MKMHVFVSYAHADRRLALGFAGALKTQLAASRHFEFDVWQDPALLPGQPLDPAIAAAMRRSRVGLFLLSPALLASEYVIREELPCFLGRAGKHCIPVGLKPVSRRDCELHGLQHLVEYRLPSPSFGEPKNYRDCRGVQREHFVEGLAAKLHDLLV